jgi:hypothetical protein
MKDLECPNCGAMMEVPPDCEDPDYTHEAICPMCGKVFGFRVEYWPSYSSYPLPCANGLPHQWQEVPGYPREFYMGKRQCKYCGIEKNLE